MKRSKFSDSQILAVLKQAEVGTAVPDLCREHGISSGTSYKWRAKFGGMDASLYAEFSKDTAALMNGVENTLKHTEGGTAGPTQMAARGTLHDVIKLKNFLPIIHLQVESKARH